MAARFPIIPMIATTGMHTWDEADSVDCTMMILATNEDIKEDVDAGFFDGEMQKMKPQCAPIKNLCIKDYPGFLLNFLILKFIRIISYCQKKVYKPFS